MDTHRYLKSTPLLDYNSPAIASLVTSRKWQELPEKERVKAIYNFVKDEILFGYNISDDIPASQVLSDGYGQCNTKATLFMALLRAAGVPCRFHGFTINKALQKGAITGLWYKIAPANIIHSWVEVLTGGRWLSLEGLILDKKYLHKLQQRFSGCEGTFCGYGVYTGTFTDPPTEWTGGDTFIQSLGINHDFGLYDSPDEFYTAHGANLTGAKRLLFVHLVRKLMNRHIRAIREG